MPTWSLPSLLQGKRENVRGISQARRHPQAFKNLFVVTLSDSHQEGASRSCGGAGLRWRGTSDWGRTLGTCREDTEGQSCPSIAYLGWETLQRLKALSSRLSVFLSSSQKQVTVQCKGKEKLLIQLHLSGAGSEQWKERDNFPVGGGASGKSAITCVIYDHSAVSHCLSSSF